MKFSKYVGYEKIDIIEKENKDYGLNIKLNFGFDIDKKIFKKVFDYIRSWFIRYDIKFTPIDPHLLLYVIGNIKDENRKNIIERVNEDSKNILYKPKGTLTIIDYNDSIDYIVIDYFKNKKYSKELEKILYITNVNILKEMCYVKLFEIEKGKYNYKMYYDMMYSCPNIPELNINKEKI